MRNERIATTKFGRKRLAKLFSAQIATVVNQVVLSETTEANTAEPFLGLSQNLFRCERAEQTSNASRSSSRSLSVKPAPKP